MNVSDVASASLSMYVMYTPGSGEPVAVVAVKDDGGLRADTGLAEQPAEVVTRGDVASLPALRGLLRLEGLPHHRLLPADRAGGGGPRRGLRG